MNYKQIKSDMYGNPRFVFHFLAFLTQKEKEETDVFGGHALAVRNDPRDRSPHYSARGLCGVGGGRSRAARACGVVRAVSSGGVGYSEFGRF